MGSFLEHDTVVSKIKRINKIRDLFNYDKIKMPLNNHHRVESDILKCVITTQQPLGGVFVTQR